MHHTQIGVYCGQEIVSTLGYTMYHVYFYGQNLYVLMYAKIRSHRLLLHTWPIQQ